MPWHARLQLDHRLEAGRTVARFTHDGPLRILQSLYPEGDAVCHNVVVHPPGGLVGGDTLDIRVHVEAGAHGLVTTPGATRFYRSQGELALQHCQLQVDDGARLEWLPLETIAYSACQAENRAVFTLAPGAEVLAWDVCALGLPTAGQPFAQGDQSGCLQQHMELPGLWLERARIRADDARLLDGPLGLAGHRCMATFFFACGSELPRARRELALDAARSVIDAHELRATAGATAPNPRMVVVRVLAPLVEPAMDLVRKVRAAWRPALWDLPGNPPRVWST